MKLILTFLVVITCNVSLSAQTTATTPDGRTVLLKPDGSWEFVQASPNTKAQSVDCETYSTGDVKLINNTGSTIKGAINFSLWRDGNGKGGVVTESRHFTLAPGKSVIHGDVYQGNVSYSARKQVPDPDNLGQYRWTDYIYQENGYLQKCRVVEFIVR